MQKIIKSLFVLAGSLLLLDACTKVMDTALNGEGAQTVAFTLSADALSTEAVADGDGAAANVNHWIMEVRDSDGDLFNRQEETGVAGVLTHTFNVTLAKGQTYDILFWADTEGSYDTADLTNVTLLASESTGYAANRDSRDAFTAVETGFSTTAAATLNVTLKRPFAQLNVIFTDLDDLYATVGNVTEYSKFAPVDFLVKAKLPTSFNVQTQIAGSPVSTPLSITAANGYRDNFASHAAEATLFMDYFFATAAAKDIIDIDFSFTSNGIPVSHVFSAIPFTRNFRTNVKGNLLTAETALNITVDPLWDSKPDGSGDINVNYSYVSGNSAVKTAIQSKTNDVVRTGGEKLQVNIKENTSDDIIIPDNTPDIVTPEIILNFESLAGDREIVIRDEKHITAGSVETGAIEYAGNITVIVPEGTTADQVKILTDKSSVTVRGKFGTVIASSAPNTTFVGNDAEVSLLKVLKGNVVILGGGKVASIVREAGNPDAVTNVYLYFGAEWTDIESERSAVLVPIIPVASDGSKQYFALSEALADIRDGGTLKVWRDDSETPAKAVEMLTSGDVTIDADSPVTVTMSTLSKASSVDNDGMAYFRSNGGKKNITVGSNVTLRMPADAAAKGAMYFGYSSSTPVNVILNGRIEAYEPYLGSLSSMTVNPTGSLASVSECLLIRWGATLDVDGVGSSWSNADPQVKLGYGSQQGGIVTFNDTYVDAGAWWAIQNRNGKEDYETKLALANTTLVANGFSAYAKSSGTSSAYTVVLKGNSVMKINGGFNSIADGSVNIEAGSTISASTFTNAGVINIDASNATAKTILVISCTGAADYGSVNVTGNYETLILDNNLYVTSLVP